MTDILPNVVRHELPVRTYLDHQVQDCDILLWEPTTLAGRFIAIGTDGPWCHATVVLSWPVNEHCVWMSAGFEEHRDAVVEPLTGVVRRAPGKISVFRANVPFRPLAVKESMVSGLEGNYAWGNIWLFFLKYSPGVRWLKRTPWLRRKIERAAQRSGGAICSQYVAKHFARSDVVFVQKFSGEVTPNDLGQSASTDYLGTLV